MARRSGPARCRHCGASLKWDCPVCRRPHWVDEPKCACGFPLALREPLVHHFVAAQHAFRCHDMDSARMHLEQVQKYAPHHVGARNGMAKIRQQQTDIEYARMAWELALSGKRLVAASRALEAWRKLVDPSSPEVQAAWKEVIKGLRQAEELAARAGGSSGWILRPRGAFIARAWRLRPTCPMPWTVFAAARRTLRPALWCSRWETGSGCPGRPLPRMAWDRSPSPSYANVAVCPSIPPMERESPRSPRASSRTVASRGARPSATRCLASEARPSRWRRSRRARCFICPTFRMFASSHVKALWNCRGYRPMECSRFGSSASAVLRRPTPATATGSDPRWTRPSIPT